MRKAYSYKQAFTVVLIFLLSIFKSLTKKNHLIFKILNIIFKFYKTQMNIMNNIGKTRVLKNSIDNLFLGKSFKVGLSSFKVFKKK